MKLENAPEIKEMLKEIIETLGLKHIDLNRIYCIKSYNTRTNAVARIWSLPKVWRKVLEIEPAYVIEVISEKFFKLPKDEQYRVLIHELIHIPKRFSGGLVPHKNRYINFSYMERKFFKEFMKKKSMNLL